MDFEDWQFKLIRNALNLHYSIHRDDMGNKLSWFSLAAYISAAWEDAGHFSYDKDGEEIPVMDTEAIRRFCKGTSPLGPERRAAVFHYVTDPAVGLLSKEELMAEEQDYHLAKRFIDYLAHDGNREIKTIPASLSGAYGRKKAGSDIRLREEIIFEEPTEAGVIKVSLTEASQFGEEMPDAEGGGKPERQTRYFGWGILTPEDYLLIFLRRKIDGKNLYLFALGSDISHTNSADASYIAFYSHRLPVTAEGKASALGQAIPDMGDYWRDSQLIFTKG